MPRRKVQLRVTGRNVRGVVSSAIELEDDKGNWLPLVVDTQVASESGFEITAQIGDVLDLPGFDKAVKQLQDNRAAETERLLKAQADAEAQAASPAYLKLAGTELMTGSFTNEHGALVEVTPNGQPTREQLNAVTSPSAANVSENVPVEDGPVQGQGNEQGQEV